MCHWESSRRSLYVKTVWTNGHHHAILSPEDPILKSEPIRANSESHIRKSFSVLSRQRSAKVPTPVVREHGELSVSAVQIFLDALKTGRPRSKRQSAVSMYQIREREKALADVPTVEVIPANRVKTRNISDEVQFSLPRKNLRSNSYDVGMSPAVADKSWIEPYVSGITPGQNTGTVLSERVMLWLDLARQSQEGRVQKFEEDKLREEAERKQTKKSLTGSNWVPYFDYEEVRSKNVDDLHLNEHSILKSSSMKLTLPGAIAESVSEAHRELEDSRGMAEGRKCENVAGDGFGISSKLESKDGEVLGEYERRSNGILSKYSNANATSKRQFHIFMPNVPKKKVDCEGRSILSDISSRYSTKVKFTV